jgi:ribosomal protein L37AE/L43A
MEKDAEEYRKESLCPKCGDEREELTMDNNTFWFCDACEGDHSYLDDIDDMPPEDDEPEIG